MGLRLEGQDKPNAPPHSPGTESRFRAGGEGDDAAPLRDVHGPEESLSLRVCESPNIAFLYHLFFYYELFSCLVLTCIVLLLLCLVLGPMRRTYVIVIYVVVV